MFDETYYMKDAFSLLRWGYERSLVDGANDKILASDGNWRTLEVFTDNPSFIVHPPVGTMPSRSSRRWISYRRC